MSRGAGGESGPIHILLAADARCAIGAAVSIRSIIDNADARARLHFHLLVQGMGSTDLVRLAAVAPTDESRVTVSVREFDSSPLAHLTRSKLITHVSYARLMLDSVLPREVTRCVYVDADVAFQRDIAELWELPLAGTVLAAVPNADEADARDHQRRLGLSAPRYLNAGILLVDVTRWRSIGVGPRAIQFAERLADRLILHDQDALNGALEMDWIELDWYWNVFVGDRRLLEDSRAVFHYMGAPKPWHPDYDGRFRAVFEHYLDRTAYSGTRPWNPAGIGAFLARARRRVPYIPGMLRMIRRAIGSR